MMNLLNNIIIVIITAIGILVFLLHILLGIVEPRGLIIR
jgi:hypothetical protein